MAATDIEALLSGSQSTEDLDTLVSLYKQGEVTDADLANANLSYDVDTDSIVAEGAKGKRKRAKQGKNGKQPAAKKQKTLAGMTVQKGLESKDKETIIAQVNAFRLKQSVQVDLEAYPTPPALLERLDDIIKNYPHLADLVAPDPVDMGPIHRFTYLMANSRQHPCLHWSEMNPELIGVVETTGAKDKTKTYMQALVRPHPGCARSDIEILTIGKPWMVLPPMRVDTSKGPPFGNFKPLGYTGLWGTDKIEQAEISFRCSAGAVEEEDADDLKFSKSLKRFYRLAEECNKNAALDMGINELGGIQHITKWVKGAVAQQRGKKSSQVSFDDAEVRSLFLSKHVRSPASVRWVAVTQYHAVPEGLPVKMDSGTRKIGILQPVVSRRMMRWIDDKEAKAIKDDPSCHERYMLKVPLIKAALDQKVTSHRGHEGYMVYNPPKIKFASKPHTQLEFTSHAIIPPGAVIVPIVSISPVATNTDEHKACGLEFVLEEVYVFNKGAVTTSAPGLPAYEAPGAITMETDTECHDPVALLAYGGSHGALEHHASNADQAAMVEVMEEVEAEAVA